MRTKMLGSLAPSMLIVVASSMMAISTASLVAPAYAAGIRTCTSNTSSACATCDTTNKVYQCKPAALPTGCIYGTCPTVGNGPCGASCATQTCGTTDWNCDTPPVSIQGSTACKGEDPDVCCTQSGGC